MSVDISSLGNANGGWQQQQKTQNQMQFDTSMTSRRRCWCWPPGLKRAADPSWGNGWGAQQKSAAGGPMSPLKMQLVEAVKRFQQENPDRKEAWHAFCDAELGGNRDPARQEPDVLQAFLDQQGVSVDISSLGNANGGWQQQQKTQNQMQFDTSMTSRRRCWCWPPGLKRAADPSWGNGWGAQQKSAAGGPMSPLKMQLVEAVKRFQQENPDRKEAWHAFCDAELGGNRDPARPEPDVLQACLDQPAVSVDISSLGNPDSEACARFQAILRKSMRVHRSVAHAKGEAGAEASEVKAEN